ncbi:putative D (cytosine-5)-methyltransferase PliMCI-like [Daphnia sinensis]|uniref:DNA (cytosine-5-)-methyltransferase n=1 Tax=Daphnia sinensis TaxID=1820382 RepID=A0AAD5KDZ7_9CRUS|nr:putative D (cytosine-5)-methyltransferase PliMCI-like [Daphnia sinensis]
MTVYLIDLFCGAGGFSEGARQAGAVVAVAVDCWDVALDVHKKHHPGAVHMLRTIGDVPPEQFAQELITALPENYREGIDWLHVHASPPCQQVSKARRNRCDVSDTISLVRYVLDLIDCISYNSFSIEEVDHHSIRELYDSEGIPWAVIDMSKHGVPQTRKRLFAFDGWNPYKLKASNPPKLTELLVAPDTAVYVTSSSLCPGRMQGWARGEYKGGYKRGFHISKPKLVHTCKLFYTVTSAPFFYYDGDFSFIGGVGLEELEQLQTFPIGYITQNATTHRRMLIANAVPPKMAWHIIKTVKG